MFFSHHPEFFYVAAYRLYFFLPPSLQSNFLSVPLSTLESVNIHLIVSELARHRCYNSNKEKDLTFGSNTIIFGAAIFY